MGITMTIPTFSAQDHPTSCQTKTHLQDSLGGLLFGSSTTVAELQSNLPTALQYSLH